MPELLLDRNSTTDLIYEDSEINRGIGPVNGACSRIDGSWPTDTAIQHARQYGQVSVLDAGCGTGYGLLDLKEQVTRLAPLDPASIEIVGVSLEDFRDRIIQDNITRKWLDSLQLLVGNLATIELPPAHFDVAYSYQVLLHNKDIIPILKNVLPALKREGAYYCDATLEQQPELEAFANSAGANKWQLRSKQITRHFMTGTHSRGINKFVRILETN